MMLLPFVMSIIQGFEKSLFCLGASFSENFKTAKQKAAEEAIMLANDILCQKSLERIQNVSSQKRMRSQVDPVLSKRRFEYLRKITISTALTPQFGDIPLTQSLQILKLKPDDVNLCYLHSENDVGFVVRAVIKNFVGLSQYRQKYAHTQKSLLDPIC